MIDKERIKENISIWHQHFVCYLFYLFSNTWILQYQRLHMGLQIICKKKIDLKVSADADRTIVNGRAIP